jgi:hypothetical protein
MPSTHPYATGKECRFNENTRRDLILKVDSSCYCVLLLLTILSV